jgi:hypothetical protein
MTRLHLLLALALAALLTSTAEAGPFRRRSSSPATCTGPNCSGGDTSTAQGVAEIMSARGGRGHFGGNSGREGVGEGPTREAAIQACCYHPQNGRRDSKIDMSRADVGAAQASNGRWFACIRDR